MRFASVSVRAATRIVCGSPTVRQFSSVGHAAGITMSPAAKNLYARNPNLLLSNILASGRSPSHKQVITKVF